MAKKKSYEDIEAPVVEDIIEDVFEEAPVVEPVIEAKPEPVVAKKPAADLDDRGNVRVDMVFGHLPAVPRD